MTGYKDTYIYIPKKGIIRGSIAFEKGKVIGYDEDSSFEKLDENYIVIPGLSKNIFMVAMVLILCMQQKKTWKISQFHFYKMV